MALTTVQDARARYRVWRAKRLFIAGVNQYDKRRYLRALDYWKMSYALGDVNAALRVALLFRDGEGVLPSAVDARVWFARAAELGSVEAKVQLALILLDGVPAMGGLGSPGTWLAALANDRRSKLSTSTLIFPYGAVVERDETTAFALAFEAAQSGQPAAATLLGDMYRAGRGCLKNSATALLCYRRAAEHDFAAAQFAIGNMYFSGEALAVDYSEAFVWYEKAAKQGYVRAQVALAHLLFNGLGRPRNRSEAIGIFTAAAKQGDAVALYHVGLLCLTDGDGCPKDIIRAETALRRAAKQQYLPAIARLADFYFTGIDIDPDFREVARWSKQAAEGGIPRAQFLFARCLALGEGVMPDAREAMRWYERAARSGYPPAAFEFAVGLVNDAGGAEDIEVAMNWLTVSAEAGFLSAQIKLGQLYWSGNVIAQDIERAAHWFERAAISESPEALTIQAVFRLQTAPTSDAACYAKEVLRRLADQGYAPACLQYGQLLAAQTGNEIEADSYYLHAAERGLVEAQHQLANRYFNSKQASSKVEDALGWLRRAAHADYVPAQFQLAVLLSSGKVSRADPAGAFELFRRAADAGHLAAQYNLGILLSRGEGCQPDPKEAYCWFSKAASRDMPEAQVALGDALWGGRGVEIDIAAARQWYYLAARRGYKLGELRLEAMLREGFAEEASASEMLAASSAVS